MNTEFRLPDVGEGLTEAEILTWHVQVGDHVTVNQVIVEIETAKASVELPSPEAGIVAELLVSVGQIVPVGTPIISFGTPAPKNADLDNSDLDDADLHNADLEKAPSRTPVLVGYGVREEVTRRRRKVGPLQVAAGLVAAPPAVAQAKPKPVRFGGLELGRAIEQHLGGSGAPARARAKPPVRKLAREYGIDLAGVVPTGPEGTVTRGDLEAALVARSSADPTSRAALGSAAASPASLVGPVREYPTDLPVRGVQRVMAAAMVRSAFSSPHVTEWLDVDVSATVRLVEQLRVDRSFNQDPELGGARIGVFALACRAFVLAVRRHPQVNATWLDTDQGPVVRRHSGLHLGFAAATPRGLLVPTVTDAGRRSLASLAGELGRLTEAARAGTLSPAELSGSTVTVTNVGVFGVDGGTPILNPGESVILALGRVSARPWVHKGGIKVRQVMTLSLSFDHRVVDGALGSQLLADTAALLHKPQLALAWA